MADNAENLPVEGTPEGDPTPSPETGAEGQTGGDTPPDGGTPDNASIESLLRDGFGKASKDTPAAGKPDTGADKAPQGEKIPDPPQSWGALAREEWAKLPKAVRDMALAREKEFSQGFTDQGGRLRRAEDAAAMFGGILRPFEDYLRANGGIGTAVKEALETGRAITSGDVNQRAQAVSQVLAKSGIGIKGLTEFLSNNPAALGAVQQGKAIDGNPQQGQQMTPQQIQQMINKGIQDGLAASTTRQSENAVMGEVQKFKATKPEFLDQVSAQMVDNISAVVAKGQKPDVKAIYEAACWANPEIRQLLMANPDRLKTGSAGSPAKTAAASSVSGSPGGSVKKEVKGGDVRDILEDQFREKGLI